MERSWYLRLGVVIASAFVSFAALWPTLDNAGWLQAPQWVKDTFPGQISPGLDIRGGLRLMYGVEIDDYLRDRRDRERERLVRELGVLLDIYEEDESDSATREQIAQVYDRVQFQTVGGRGIRATFTDENDRNVVNAEWLAETFPDFRLVENSASRFELQMRADRIEELTSAAVEQAKLTIEQRIDGMGLREAAVFGRDSDIIVEVPGANEQVFDEIREIIARTARLDFKAVDEESTELEGLATNLPEGIRLEYESGSPGENLPPTRIPMLIADAPPCAETAENCQSARELLTSYVDSIQAEIPPTHQLLISNEDRPEWKTSYDIPRDHEAWRTYMVFSATNVTGEDIDNARWTFANDPQSGSGPVVLLSFNATGATKWAELTGRNVKRRVAIVLDDVVASAPQIQTRIDGGNTQITLGGGDQTTAQREAEALVVVLNAGALPAPLSPANEQLIGPTLGGDSVRAGATGAVVGIAFVLLFMLVYYQAGGLIADIMVLLNLLTMLALMAFFGATLTLPGIAAISLTVGMALDGNVLILERMREEVRLGKSPRAAVDQGYHRAMSSVMDGQLTTLIAGVVLFQYGTGPIRGFAVMLMLGIVTSLFTSVFCSRVAMDWLVRGGRAKRLRIG